MQIVCGKCEYYYVTHDRARPWGCRKFGFKSSRLPSHEVRSTTGMNCAYFTEKNFNQTSEKIVMAASSSKTTVEDSIQVALMPRTQPQASQRNSTPSKNNLKFKISKPNGFISQSQ